ncbi:excinuclease ABC subunit UvrA [Candidatus Roizmanbacteria bacterium CG_4_10_14_0_8_um_filter_35_28]|uniref:UvrABC system protein A n=1 Tax=Candidatus Roizmanbacteria bacterium CG_4_10_14_0_8_um_filter_35_28 TaxID=1974827 RepID=A0A2M7QGK9_9BACT|nr:MAG: excinuclease ABC subunit UvrA [Candidatus Roizmanbacteria bacterium CG_4_10_14_0_8_um_filter_35_28]
MDYIRIKGARQHNLKNINLDIPKNKLVLITGISGSGKSSLAFDTIYAEGQRRYVESLSAYARQFLGVMDKPDVDLIEGLSPSISIDQKTVSHNPRSTVGTITEIYDYFRLLFSRIGHPHCPNCQREISKMSVDEIVGKIISVILRQLQDDKIKPHSFVVYSPVVREKKGEFKELFANLRSKGFTKVSLDGREKSLNEEIDLIKTNKHTIEVEVDRFSVRHKELKNEVFLANLKSRLGSSVEQSLNLSDGLVIVNKLLFSEKFSCSDCNISLTELEPRMFSFNSPLGACPNCKGIGTIFAVDPELVFNKNLSILEGGILSFNRMFFHETWYIRLLKKASEEEGIDLNKPINQLTNNQIKILLYGTDKVYRVPGVNRYGRPTVIYEKFDGIVSELERRYFENQGDYRMMEIQKYMRENVCPECQGAKLKSEVLSVTVDNLNITQLSDRSIEFLLDYFSEKLSKLLTIYEQQIARPIIKEIVERLTFLTNVGLSYLTISRQAKTLAGGELQRIRLASQIGTGLTGVLYVLDEPSIGLHPRDVSALIKSLQNLKKLGNSVLVVEHDRETIESADYLIELGPKAGKHGGEIVFTGSLSEMKKSTKSLTGLFITKKKTIELRKRPLCQNQGMISLKGVKQYNLKSINLDLPLGNLIAVTGVSGSGKSSLVVETLYPALKYYLEGYYQEAIGQFEKLLGYQYLDRVYLVDQSPIGRTPRSNPATYVGFFDEIREIFANSLDAKERGFEKGRFSFNVKGGRCEKCQGAGVLKIEMQFLADVYVTCDVCQGRRYNQETLEVKYKGKNIYDILKMTIDEAAVFFSNHWRIFSKLDFMQRTGLGYLELGQPAPTLSGGEAQRIKLVNELSRRETGRTLYILDEPTTGLHFFDIEKLLITLHQLVDRGNTVIIIEHNLDVIKNCQYIIDLGPEGGESGGRVIYQGEINGIVKVKSSYTGQYLNKITNYK